MQLNLEQEDHQDLVKNLGLMIVILLKQKEKEWDRQLEDHQKNVLDQ
jgi:hypothetical protein